jgi:hypothetical protein
MAGRMVTGLPEGSEHLRQIGYCIVDVSSQLWLPFGLQKMLHTILLFIPIATFNHDQERTTKEKPVIERTSNHREKYLPLLFTVHAIKFNRNMEEKKTLLKKAT